MDQPGGAVHLTPLSAGITTLANGSHGARAMKQVWFTLVPFLLSLVYCLPARAGFVEVTLPALGAEPGQIAGGSFAAWPDVDSDGDQDCVQSCDLVTTAGRTTGVQYFDNDGPGLSFSRTTIHQNPTNL
jgi:hypothetical protein